MIAADLKEGDYNPYYKTYIDKVGTNDLLEILRKQSKNFPNFLESLPEEKLHYAYAEGKWTLIESLQHLIDTERIFQYRALRIARNDKTPLPGYDQDTYVPYANTASKTIAAIILEYKSVRESTIQLFASFSEEILLRKGIASNSPVSVAALGFIICGHQRHHRNLIREHYL